VPSTPHSLSPVDVKRDEEELAHTIRAKKRTRQLRLAQVADFATVSPQVHGSGVGIPRDDPFWNAFYGALQEYANIYTW